MVDLRRLMPVTLVTLALGVSLSPIVSAQRADQLPGRPVLPALTAAGPGSSAAPATAASQYMPVRTMGSAKNESSDPLRQKFTFPLYSMVDGSLVGNATDDLACSQTVPPPCVVFDAVTTFRFTQGTFPLGTIVNHAQVSVAPDAQRPGFIINGSRATGNTIQSATGAYAGRTGTIIISGANDAKNFPNELTQDDFWLIALQ
jgi:hypothetical protein